jgi:Tfp pilus assembly protein PilV
MSRDNRRKWSNFAVDTDALIRLSIPFFVLLVANLALTWVISWQIGRFAEKYAAANYELLISFQLLAGEIQSTLVWGQLLFGFFAFMMWLVYSHRIFGPMVALRRHVQNLLAGNYGEKVVLRKFDEFRPLADELNSLADRLKNSKGQSLVQVMVAAAIMGIIMMAMVSTQTMQSRENRSLSEKLAILDFQRLLTSSLADPAVCTFLLTNAGPVRFSAAQVQPNSSPAPIDLGNQLLAGAVASAPAIARVNEAPSPLSLNVVVQSIQLTNIKCEAPCANPAASDQFVGTVQVNFVPNRLVRALAPASSRVLLQTQNVGGNKEVQSCLVAASAGGSGMILPGSVCGWANSHYGIYTTCDGHNPQVSCPAGYTQVTFTQDSTYDATNNATYYQWGYFCRKD